MTNNQITVTCRANLHRKCVLQCHCVCHTQLDLIPPETTTPLPPQLHHILKPDLGWPTTQEQPT